ncbi:hypothetical protein D3C76_1797820 [compost metagenome]
MDVLGDEAFAYPGLPEKQHLHIATGHSSSLGKELSSLCLVENHWRHRELHVFASVQLRGAVTKLFEPS